LDSCKPCYGGCHLYNLEAALAWKPRARAEQAQSRRAAEADIGARLVCETPGMPALTERQVARHERLYGSDGVEDVLPYLSLSGTSRNGPATHGGMRPVRSRSSTPVPTVVSPWNSTRTRNLGLRIVTLHKRGRSAMAIADTIGKSDRVVRRYLREAEQAGLLAESA
jgi:hypothetical protein